MTNCIYDNQVICGDANKRCQKCGVYFARVAASPLGYIKPELLEQGIQCLIDNNIKNCDANVALAQLIKIITDNHNITTSDIYKALRVLCEYGVEYDESYEVLQALCYILFDFEIDDVFENAAAVLSTAIATLPLTERLTAPTVARRTMLETTTTALSMDVEIAKPTKVWLVTYEWCDDYDTNSNRPMVFSSLEKAQKQFHTIVDDEKHNGWIADIPPECCNGDEYVICEDETQFEAYPTGCYQEKHILVAITEVVVDEVQ